MSARGDGSDGQLELDFRRARPTVVAAASKAASSDRESAGGRSSRAPRTEPRGSTFDPAFDRERLGRQRDLVEAFMADGSWHSLGGIAAGTGAPEASASARLRDLRREGAVVERRRRGDPSCGLFEYRLSGRTP